MSNNTTDAQPETDSDKHLLLAEIVWLAHKAFPEAVRYLAEKFPGYTLVPCDRPELYHQGVKVKLTGPCPDYEPRDNRQLLALVEWHVVRMWNTRLACTADATSGSDESRDLRWFDWRATVLTGILEVGSVPQTAEYQRWKQGLRQKVDRLSVECALWELIHKHHLIHDDFPFGFDLRAQVERLATLSREECEKELETIDAQLRRSVELVRA